MIHFDLPKEKSSIIKVIGIGGGGNNAVNFMHGQGIEGVNFIICNTDAQAISNSKVPNKIQLGPHLTQGLGAGANPEIGRQATEESLEEIRRILEVNTKMAFITAGMGGGTGTGGAPIVARICKEMGILTVGIVTTPFAYEGKKRILQGEEGINRLKENVDTLLIISNDKLRHQYGNLKMKEAFAKADNVLATAAKCITDVINSTGQINVDFADVCTVMRNGGVAILGSGAAEGDNRAQRAIELALNSPLLNDNDIRGAKWILININSAEGEHEFTMDEVDIIQNYLLSQAGSNSDVIMGLGYDNTLQGKIGITLIATGFDHTEAKADAEQAATQKPAEEKIMMTLEEPERHYGQQALFPEATPAPVAVAPASAPVAVASAPVAATPAPIAAAPDEMAPTLVEPKAPDAGFFMSRVAEPDRPMEPARPAEPEEPIRFTLSDETPEAAKPEPIKPEPAKPTPPAEPVRKTTYIEPVRSAAPGATRTVMPPAEPSGQEPARPGQRGFLSRPSNIYEDGEETPKASPVFPEETPTFDMQLVIKNEVPARPEPPVRQEPPARPEPPVRQNVVLPPAHESTPLAADEMDEQRRKAAERLQKLRNLSFNVNAQDAGNEFEAVPAYMRRNMELYNTVNSIENFYSNYTVKPSEDNKAEISTINTFLEGKKPD